MKKFSSILILFGLLATGVWGQRSDTIYQNLATNATTVPTAPGWFISTNIGQSFHQVVFKFASQPTKTCHVFTGAFPSGKAFLYGSYVKLTATQLGAVIPIITTSDPTNLTVTLQGTGAYPYIYVLLTQYDAANCQVTVNYTGTLNPVTPLDPTWQQQISFCQTSVTGNGTFICDGSNNPFGTNMFALLYGYEISTGIDIDSLDIGCGMVGNTNPITNGMINFQGLKAGQVLSVHATKPFSFCTDTLQIKDTVVESGAHVGKVNVFLYYIVAPYPFVF